jgi:transcriptional regulator with GAF, ATPase, and Fis domain
MGRSIDRIPPETMRAFTSYQWPGNIRELQNLVERGVILSKDGTLPDPFPVLASRSVRDVATAADSDDLAKRRQIEDALHASRGRVSGIDGAAQALGVAPSTLESRIQRLGIDKSAFRRRRSTVDVGRAMASA